MRAFTRTELLVVLAIIAILAALLLPGLAKAKAHAWRIQCVNHQKQLVLTWALYSTDNREALMAALKDAGIGTGIHYPIPLHLQKAYASLNYKPGDFPVTERVAKEIVSLPMFPNLTEEQQKRVVNEVRKFVAAEQLEPVTGD